jgi:hypothetical protein
VARPPRQLYPSNPVHFFADQMRDLYLVAGQPGQAVVASRMACSRPSLSAFTNARRFPTWDDTQAFVRACDGNEEDVERWRDLWVKVRIVLQKHPELLRQDEPTAGPFPAMPRVVPGSSASLEALSEPVPGLPPDEELKQDTVQITWFDDNEEFYSTAAEHVQLARRRIALTYIRRFPPSHYTTQAAATYFQTVLDWAREPGARSVRRILAISTDEMRQWAVQHLAETREIRNYEARAVPWEIKADSFNLALMDDATVFIAFSGTAFQELSGLKVSSAKLLAHFLDYFNQVWSSGTPLQNYLARPPDSPA